MRISVRLLTRVGGAALCLVAGCAPEPGLADPYEANAYFWPYEAPEGAPFECPLDPEAPLGRAVDGTPIEAMNDCTADPEGAFPMCATFDEAGQLQISWEGATGFAMFVTEPDAIVPMAPNAPVTQGETYWAIGPIEFPTDGFPSPQGYGSLAEGSEDVTEQHMGPLGGAPLEPGLCYKITIINNAFQSASLVVGWQ